MKHLHSTLIIILLSCSLSAQEHFLLKGLVFKKGANTRLSAIKVLNKVNNELSLSDEWGNFSIHTKLGDTILFEKEGLQGLEKLISSKQNLIIYLSESILLDEVIVKQQSKKKEQQEILAGFKSKGVFYNGKPPFLAYIFSPLTALNELIGKDANNAQRFAAYIQKENGQNNVDTHFNEQIIRKSISIKNEELIEYMYLYRPKPEDVRYRNTYDDMAYVKKSYQEYLQRKNKRN